MRREAPRTLYTFSPEYQNLPVDAYDVLVIDNNSSEPLDEALVKSFGPNYHYLNYKTDAVSPVFALNHGISLCTSEIVACHIDGARLLSPGILTKMIALVELHPTGLVYTIGFLLGPKIQNLSSLEGYNQATEDKLLESVNWHEDGYSLFQISCLAGSSSGYLNSVPESNCFALSKNSLIKHGGFDERFVSRGGGLANLEIFARYVQQDEIVPIVLMGEGTFHQFHGGISTNVENSDHPMEEFRREYFSIFNYKYKNIKYEPFLYGQNKLSVSDNEKFLSTKAIDILLILIDTADVKTIRQYILRLVERWPENYPFILRCGRICRHHGYLDLARELYLRCLRIKNNDEFLIQSDLAVLDYEAGKHKKAKKEYDRIIKASPITSEAHIGLFKYYRDQKKYNKAYEKARQIIAENHPKDYLTIHLHAATTLFSLKKYKKAKKHLYFLILWSEQKRNVAIHNLTKILLEENKNELAEIYLSPSPGDKGVKGNISNLLRSLHAQGKYSQVQYYFKRSKQNKSTRSLNKRVTNPSDEMLEMGLYSKTNQNASKSTTKSIVCILGMHRSGTSCLTGSIQEAGFESPKALAWNYDNLKGNREEMDVIAINHKVLQQNQQSWRRVRTDWDLSWSAELVAQRDHIIMDRLQYDETWIFKDPRTVLTLPFWQEIALPLIKVGSFRHPMKSALSLFNRNHIPIKQGLKLWKQYNEKILEYLHADPFPLICFDSTQTSYSNQLDEILAYINSEINTPITINSKAAHDFYETQLESPIYAVDFDHLAASLDLTAFYGDCLELYGALMAYTNKAKLPAPKIDPQSNDLIIKLIENSIVENGQEKLDELVQLYSEFGSQTVLQTNILNSAIAHEAAIPGDIVNEIRKTSNPHVLLLLANYLLEHDFYDALKILEKIEENFPDYVETMRLNADILHKMEDYNWAKSYYQQIVEQRPLDRHSFLRLFDIAKKEGNALDEVQQVARAFDCNVYDPGVTKLFVASIIRHSDVDMLSKYLFKLMSNRHLNAGQWIAFSRLFITNGDMDRALLALLQIDRKVEDENLQESYVKLLTDFSEKMFPAYFRSELMLN